MKRSDFIKGALGITIGTGVAANSLVGCKDYTREDYKESEKSGWTNWSGLQKSNPKNIAVPRDENELAKLLKESEKIRFVGSGHSFMPLVNTNEVLISMDAMNGIVSYDDANKTATIKAGTKLASLTRALAKINQGVISMPDVDYQTWAGSISTATHGTGKNKMALHAYIKAMKLVTAEGKILECSESENSDLLQAAKVSLGTLGAITECTIQNRELYKLHRKVYFKPLQFVLENGKKLFEENEYFELYYIPHSGYCLLISHDEYNGEILPRAKSEDEDGLKDLEILRDYLSFSPALRKWAVGLFIDENILVEDYKDEYWQLVSQPRVTKFNESEYHIPKEKGFECFDEICKKIDGIKKAYFPIEFRIIKQDDAWLSPFYQRDCHSIALHTHAEEEYKYLIKDFGPIFKKYNGRPHWGKLNDLTKDDYAKAYPKWNDFLKIRKELDPKGKLLNNYTQKIMLG